MDQKTWDKLFLRIAKDISKMSHCVSKQVCALAVRNNRIICTGINGTIKGAVNCDEVFDKNNFDRETHHRWSLKNEVHAEANLVAEANKNGTHLQGSTIYLTLSPCNTCCLLLASVGVSRIVYSEEYDKSDFKEVKNILQNQKISLEYMPMENNK